MSDEPLAGEGSKQRRGYLIGAVLLLAALAVLAGWMLRQNSPAPQATITATPHLSGREVTLPIVIDTGGQTVNAAQIVLRYDPKLVQVKSVSKVGSIFSLWVTDQPTYSNEEGKLSYAGGVIKPGFKGSGQVGSVVLTAKRAVTTELRFDSTTSVLLADGKGTAIPLQLKPIKVSLP